MLEAELGLNKKVLGPTIGGMQRDMNPATAIDADLDRIVLEGIPFINLGRGVPDPTPFDAPKVPKMRDRNTIAESVTESGEPGVPAIPSPTRRSRVVRRSSEATDKIPEVSAETQRVEAEVEKQRTLSDLTKLAEKARKATGLKKKKKRTSRRSSPDSMMMMTNRLDLAGVPDGILKSSSYGGKLAPLTQKDKRSSALIASGGTNGDGALNATMLYESLRNQEFLRSFVASGNSNFARELASLVSEGRLPNLAKAILEMAPEEIENFLGVEARPMVLAARASRKTVRPNGSWLANIDNDPFETASHMLRMKDYHLSAIMNGVDTPALSDAVDELVGGTVAETRANVSALISKNKEFLAEAYDGAVDLAETGNKLFAVTRESLAQAIDNDTSWSATRRAIADAVDDAISGAEPVAAMSSQVSRFGRNYPRSRRKSGDWSPVASRIRDRIAAYKKRYGAPAANIADLGLFVEVEYPELLDEAAELIDIFKEKVEFGSLKIGEYADGWIDRERGELDLHRFDPSNLETIFDPNDKMGLFKTIAVVLSAASTKAPSDYEADGVLTMLDELYEWGDFSLPAYTMPKVFTERKRNIFPEIDEPTGAMTVNRPVPDDVRRVVQGVDMTPLIGDAEEPMRRMRAAIVASGNRLFQNVDDLDLRSVVADDPMGPAMRIADTFMTVADQFDMDQQNVGLLFERVAEEMQNLLQDIPSENKRKKVSAMFKDALEMLVDEIDDGNERFFQIVGSPPSRTMGRLARRISARSVPEDGPVASISINPGRPQAAYSKTIPAGITQRGQAPQFKARWENVDELSRGLWDKVEEMGAPIGDKTLREVAELLDVDSLAKIAPQIAQVINGTMNQSPKAIKQAKNNTINFDPRRDWTRKVMAALTMAMRMGNLDKKLIRQLMLPRQTEYSPAGAGNAKFVNQNKIRRILRNSFGITVYKGGELAAWSENLFDDELGTMHGSTSSEEEAAANFLGSILNQFLEGPESWTVNDGKGNANSAGDAFNEAFERYIRNPLNTIVQQDGTRVGVQIGTKFDRIKQLMLMRADIQSLVDTIIRETGTPVFEFSIQPWVEPSLYEAQKNAMGAIVDRMVSADPTYPDSKQSFIEKFVAATSTVYFMDDMQKRAMALAMGGEKMGAEGLTSSHTPFSGNNESALIDMSMILDTVFEDVEQGGSAKAAAKIAKEYRSLDGFIADIRSFSLKNDGRSRDEQIADSVLNGEYVTNDAIKAILEDKFPQFQDRYVAALSDGPVVSMAGPEEKPWSVQLAEIKERVLKQRELLELGRVSSIDEARDDLMKLASARRNILIELSKPNGILSVLSRGVTYERDPLSLGRIARSPEALQALLNKLEDSTINQIYASLVDRINDAFDASAPSLDDDISPPPLSETGIPVEELPIIPRLRKLKRELLNAAKVIAYENGWKPDDPNPTEYEILEGAGFSSYQEMLPDGWPPRITQSDLDMFPSAASKAKAAMEILSLDRRQLLELLSAPETAEATREALAEELAPGLERVKRTISARPADIEWVPTAGHMDQLSYVDAISPLDPESLASAVDALTDDQLSRLDGMSIQSEAGKAAYEAEAKKVNFAGIVRNLFGYAEIHALDAKERKALSDRVAILESEENFSDSLKRLARAAIDGDSELASQLVEEILASPETTTEDTMRMLWTFGSDSSGNSIMSMMPKSLDEAAVMALRKFKAATLAKEQADGGRKLMRETIDALPSDGKGYQPIRISEETETEKTVLSLNELIASYDGTAETAKRIIESLSDFQLENLRRNYIVPSIIQRMDRRSYEERQQFSAQSQLDARLDNLARRLSKAEINGETMENLASMIEEALDAAFGDRSSDMFMLNPEEKVIYGDIVDYFVSGGREILPSDQYRAATRALADLTAESPSGPDMGVLERVAGQARTQTALNDFQPYQGDQTETDDPDDGDLWGSFGIDITASMAAPAPPTPPSDEESKLDALSETDASTIFGNEIEGWIRSGSYTETGAWPITSDAKEAIKARLVIDALFNARRGRMPTLVASRLRSSGQYAKATEAFDDIVAATKRSLARAGYDFPADFDPTNPGALAQSDEAKLFLSTMQELVAIHMSLGKIPPLHRMSNPNNDPDFDPVEEQDIRFGDFQSLSNGKLVYYPEARDEEIARQTDDQALESEEEQFVGDPSTHPIVQQIDRTIRQVKDGFGDFGDWLEQANRYSRILGGEHYEKNSRKFGPGIIDQVMGDPSSLNLDRVIRAISDMFPYEVSDRQLGVAAASLPPDPDDQPGFPSLNSYPNSDVMNRVQVSDERRAKQKKIASSTAKASQVARQRWWTSLTTAPFLDPYEIADIEKTSDGDNFHPDAIIAGLRKHARDNNISSSALQGHLDSANDAAARRFNESAVRRTVAMLVDINKNNRNGIAGELFDLDQQLRQLENQSKELSRFYQDRIRARIQTLTSAVAVMSSGFNAERKRLMSELKAGRMTPQQVVDGIRAAYVAIQPAMLSAMNQTADLSRMAQASNRARQVVYSQMEEVRNRVEEIKNAVNMTTSEMDDRMNQIRGISNGLNMLRNDPTGLESDDITASMGIGSMRYPMIGSEREQPAPKRTLLSSVEQRLAEQTLSLNKMRRENNIEQFVSVPDMRTAMSVLRNETNEDILPTLDVSTPRALEQSVDSASIVAAADMASEALARTKLGGRFLKFSDIALDSLPSLTRRIAYDAVNDGLTQAMDTNLASEADVEAALTMLRSASNNVRNVVLFTSPDMASRILGVSKEDVEDAIATETLLTRARTALRSAHSFASRIADAYSPESVRRMTLNRFPFLSEFGDGAMDLVTPDAENLSIANSAITEAIGFHRQMPMSAENIATAFGLSDDVAKLVYATGSRRKRIAKLSSSLPSDWNFMTYRDRQRWLMSEAATVSLGQMGVANELTKLQKQIEDFGSLDGPYPALARAISGSGLTTGLFGRELVGSDGMSPLFSSNGLRPSDVSSSGAYAFADLADAVPAIYEMSDSALARFLNTDQELVSNLRAAGGALSKNASRRVAEAFGKTAEQIWPDESIPTNIDAGHFYWLASTWDRSGEAVRMLSEGMDEQSVAESLGDDGYFVARQVNQLLNDGTVNRFYDAIGEDFIDQETAANYVSNNSPRSRKEAVALLAQSGYGEPQIVSATGINSNTVRNSLHELRKAGVVPDAVGSPQWISQNSDSIINDYQSGMSKRAMMRKYGIGSQSLESILSGADEYVQNAYSDEPTASMANKRIKDESRMQDGPSENWLEKSNPPQMPDGSPVPPDIDPPAYVGNPFDGTNEESSLSVSGGPKNAKKMAMWRDAVSDWTSLILEGGYFSRRDVTDAERLIGMIFGDIGTDGYEPKEIVIAGDPSDEERLSLTGKDFKIFEIATRSENPASPLFMLTALPSSVKKEFNSTGVFRGVLPTLRMMLLGANDRYFRNPEDGLAIADAAREGVSTADMIQAGFLDEPELPRDMDDDLRLKLWQLRQVMRNPNLATAPPLFEQGDEKVLARLIPIMAAVDERNQLRATYGSGSSTVIGSPSQDIEFTVTGFPVAPNISELSDIMPGEAMFSQLLLSGAMQGDVSARQILDELTPRQLILANWAYGMYTMMSPIIDTFGEMMPTNVMQSAPLNLPDEPGSRRMPGERYPLPVREMDDQVFAFAFDSIFKGLKEIILNPDDFVNSALPMEDFGSAADGMNQFNKSVRLGVSAMVSAKIMSDMLATALYRRAVQATALEEYSSPFYTGQDNNLGWLTYARPRVDSFGFWSMYGPNIVYAGPGSERPYKPGWNDSLGKFVGQIPEVSELTDDENDMIEKINEVVSETPGRYWWETTGAYGQLSDETILNMSPEEFAQYVSDLSEIEFEGDDEITPTQILDKVRENIKDLSWPTPDVQKWDEWLGLVVNGIPQGTVTVPEVLNQLKNIFPYLNVNDPNDVYPVVGKSFEEAIQELALTIEGLPFTVIGEAALSRPQVAVAMTNIDRKIGVTDAVGQLASAILSQYRSNQSVGYRKISSFMRVLDTIVNGPNASADKTLAEAMALGGLLKELEDAGQINEMTSMKLRQSIMSAIAGAIFGDVAVAEGAMEGMGPEEFGSMMESILNRQLGEDLELEQVMKTQEFYDAYQRLLEQQRNEMQDEFAGYINSGMFGSIKTIGEAIAEVSPFVAATERTKRRRQLLGRYKREVLDPIKDQLLSDQQRLKMLPTFEQWLDTTGNGELTSSNDGPDGPVASMSSLTRMAMSRFTNDAVSAVVNGYDEAKEGRNKQLNSSHLLLGAWRIASGNRTGAVNQALRKLDIPIESLQNAMMTALNASDGKESEKVTGFSKAASKAMRNAILAASRRGMEFVDMGDLIVAIVDPNLHDGDDDGVGDLLSQAGISPFQIMSAVGSARVTGDMGPTASMSSGRSRMNAIDKQAERARINAIAQKAWFNSDRSESVRTAYATDGELVDEVSRLMNIYADSVDRKTISQYDWRGGESPLSWTAVRPTNSVLIYGELGQEPFDLVGAINNAVRRADALVVDPRERRRMENILNDMRLYFGNDEHVTTLEESEPTASMGNGFESMMEPIRDLYARSPKLSQKDYYSSIYGDPKASRQELEKAADFSSLRSPFNISKNLGTGTDEDVSWSTNDWSYRKDDQFIEGADSVILRMMDGDISTAQVAMISRKSGPYTDAMALVGGLRDGNEELMTTATRETMEEVGVDLDSALQVEYMGAIEAPDWDPRFVNGVRVGGGMFVVPWNTNLNAASDARAANWIPLSDIAAGKHELAFGHAEWLRRAVAMMQVDPNSDPMGEIRLSIASRLSMLARAARVRNQDLIARINTIRQAAGKKTFLSSTDMPHPMMPWGTRTARSKWTFGGSDPTASMGNNQNPVDDSLARSLDLMDVQSTMTASQLSSGAPTDRHYGVGWNKSGELFGEWTDRDRVENLWRPYVERSMQKAVEGSKGQPESQPTVYILGGATATGKSSARNNGLNGIPNYDTAMVADPDDAKIVMPESRIWFAERLRDAASFTHQESRAVAAAVARMATENGVDLVYDTSGQFNDGYQDITDWRGRGYKVIGHYFFAPNEVLAKRNEERFNRTGRYVAPTIVRTIQNNLSQILPDLMSGGYFDELYIYDSERDPMKPVMVGRLQQGASGLELAIMDPRLFRYIFTDRVGPDDKPIDIRRTKTIPIGRKPQ
jgi:ADP-ribose pyrophosphatase YjhB (NUDIX family)